MDTDILDTVTMLGRSQAQNLAKKLVETKNLHLQSEF
jgi:hypothetical protein